VGGILKPVLVTAVTELEPQRSPSAFLPQELEGLTVPHKLHRR